jgi:hypothetical protein
LISDVSKCVRRWLIASLVHSCQAIEDRCDTLPMHKNLGMLTSKECRIMEQVRVERTKQKQIKFTWH